MSASLVGMRLADRYRVEAPIAAGGMGTVYRAHDDATQRAVAVKVLLPELAEDIESIRRFEREGRAFSRLTHPGIVKVLDVGRVRHPSGAGMVCFIVMELVHGHSLAAWIERGPLPWEHVLAIGIATLDAIEHAHAAGITHRDIKPANLMVVEGSSPPEVKVLDFGVAQLKTGTVYTRLTQTGVIVGTPRFMAPEQARAEPCDARTDVYAVGLVLWSCLTGLAPFPGDNIARLVISVLEELPARVDSLVPSIPPELALIVEKAIQKVPASRFGTAAEFASALRELQRSRAARDTAASTRPSTSTSTSPPPAGRLSRWIVASLALGALALGGAALLAVAAFVFVRARAGSTSPFPSSAPFAPGPTALATPGSGCEMLMTCCLAAGTSPENCETERSAYLAYPDSAESNCLLMARFHLDSMDSMGMPHGACVVP